MLAQARLAKSSPCILEISSMLTFTMIGSHPTNNASRSHTVCPILDDHALEMLELVLRLEPLSGNFLVTISSQSFSGNQTSNRSLSGTDSSVG